MSNNIGSSNNDKNNNNQIQNDYWIWLIAYVGIGLVISFILPVALKRQGVTGGIKELYKSMSSSFGAGEQ